MRNISRVLLFLLIAGCAAPLTYLPNAPLGTEQFSSRDNILRGRIPPGWFVSTQDTLVPMLQSWLLREDLSAEIMFRHILVDSGVAALARARGLDALAGFIRSFYVEEYGNAASEPETFTLGSRTFSAIELGAGTRRIRVVVFAEGGRYYECSARTIKDTEAAPRGEALFRIQQSVLSSLGR